MRSSASRGFDHRAVERGQRFAEQADGRARRARSAAPPGAAGRARRPTRRAIRRSRPAPRPPWPRPASPRAPRPARFPRPAAGRARRFRRRHGPASRGRARRSRPRRGRRRARARAARPRPRPMRPAPVSSLPKASSRSRWPLGLSSPRSSCWPWISIVRPAMSRRLAAGTAAAPMNARLPPSAFSERRRTSGSPGSGSMPSSASKAMGRMTGGKLDLRRDRRRCLSAAHQPGVGARSQRQPERVEQDRFARAGFAGEHAKAGFEVEGERVDQHHVADDELPQHQRTPVRRVSSAARAAGSARSCACTTCCRGNWCRAPRRPSCASAGNAQREIAFDQPLERFGRVAGGLIFVDHGAEANRRREPIALALVEAADLHFLAGEMVVDQVELQPRVGGIAAFGIAADQLAERIRRLTG